MLSWFIPISSVYFLEQDVHCLSNEIINSLCFPTIAATPSAVTAKRCFHSCFLHWRSFPTLWNAFTSCFYTYRFTKTFKACFTLFSRYFVKGSEIGNSEPNVVTFSLRNHVNKEILNIFMWCKVIWKIFH